MENDRPLFNLSDDELVKLWEMASEIDDFSHETIYHISGYCDNLINANDIRYLRAGVLLQAKLCDKYKIPHPDIKLDLGEYEDCLIKVSTDEDEDEDEEEDYYDEPIEYVRENLHKTMDAFASVDGIGDFEEEWLLYDPDILEPLLVEEADENSKVEEGFVEEELTLCGYRSLLRLVRELSPDMIDVVETKVTKSKKMASFVEAIKNGLVPRKVINFWDSFVSKLWSRTCYWIPMDDLDEVKEDTGTWCCVYAIIQHYEEGILTCDLFKYMSTRIGAYIAQEFADRYCTVAESTGSVLPFPVMREVAV